MGIQTPTALKVKKKLFLITDIQLFLQEKHMRSLYESVPKLYAEKGLELAYGDYDVLLGDYYISPSSLTTSERFFIK